jgi:hypothetical protein
MPAIAKSGHLAGLDPRLIKSLRYAENQITSTQSLSDPGGGTGDYRHFALELACHSFFASSFVIKIREGSLQRTPVIFQGNESIE